MKKLFAFVSLFLVSISGFSQDLLLSEDFDYPIGNNLNQHGWKPLTAATDNPIVIVPGLSQVNYPASGGAAYLNKNGQDVIRSFSKTSNGTLYFNFQLKVFGADKRTNAYFNKAKPISPSNYFMFLSSKEEPTRPLLKFVIQDSETIYGAESRISNDYDGTIRNLHIFNANNEEIGGQTFYTRYETTSFTILYDFAADRISIGHDNDLYPLTISRFSSKSNFKITNLSNIVLSQSDRNVGSIASIDRIRIGTTWNSVFPCNKEFIRGRGVYKYDDKNRITEFNPNGTVYINDLDIHHLAKEWYAVANTESTNPIFRYFISRPDITDLVVEAPDGFRIAINGGSLTSKGTVSINRTYSDDFNTYIDFYLVGDSKTVGINNKPIVGKAGVYEGEAVIGTNLGCLATVIPLKGIIKNAPISYTEPTPLDVIVFPNTTNGRIDLKINEKAPEGDLNVDLRDNMGNLLYRKTGLWDNLQREIEAQFSPQKEGQYYLKVQQGTQVKTIRLIKE